MTFVQTTLGKLIEQGHASLQTGPFGTALHASSYVTDGTPVVAVKNIGDNRIDAAEIPRIGPEDAKRLTKYRLEQGDILFSRKGSVERRALVRLQQVGWIQGSDCIRLRLDAGFADPAYVSHVLGAPETQAWLLGNAHGATMPSLNQEILRRLPIRLPPIDEQRSIASVLGALDDKIELNRRMSETLEALARAIFTSWFVDFDPVRAKANGRQPVGLDVDTAALFPDSFEESPLGPIPRGWSVAPIGNVVEVVGGATPSTRQPRYWDGEIPFATPKDLARVRSSLLTQTARSVTRAGAAQVPSGVIEPGAVLLSSRAPIGYLAITDVPVVVNQGFIVMKPTRGVPNSYALMWAHANMDRIVAAANGTTFLEISKRSFRPLPAVVPSQKSLAGFARVVQPMFARIRSCLHETQAMHDLREALLPALVSGAVRIPTDRSQQQS